MSVFQSRVNLYLLLSLVGGKLFKWKALMRYFFIKNNRIFFQPDNNTKASNAR